jgi:hypothetical protein
MGVVRLMVATDALLELEMIERTKAKFGLSLEIFIDTLSVTLLA